MISIEVLDENKFRVTVESEKVTIHEVTVQSDDYNRLTDGKVPTEELVIESFRFLLEREPNTSILHSFDLMVIQRYFPEYEREIRSRLA